MAAIVADCCWVSDPGGRWIKECESLHMIQNLRGSRKSVCVGDAIGVRAGGV